RFPLVTTYRNSLFPSLGLKTFSQHQNGFAPVPNKDRDGSFVGFSVGDRLIPTNQRSEILINYRGNEDQFRILSASDFLQNKIPAGSLAGKTLILGATAIGIYDLRVTPISSNLPGVLVQANLLDNLYQGDFLTENLWTRLASLLMMLTFAILLGFLLPRLRILLGLLMTLALTMGHLLLVQALFQKGILLSLVAPLLTILLIFITITIYRALTEELQKKRLRNAFRSYLHPDIVEELVRDPKKLKLGGQSSECTILFADVRNFTSISEKLSPETLVQMMNEYFDPIAREILKEGGYIDKFIGDAVMAIFGAPNKLVDHPYRACRAAVAMQKKVEELDTLFQKKFGIQGFRIGIGIHTGPVVIGNIGTRERLNYTVMGDSVNLASRLESANKDLGTTILISEQTNEKCANEVLSKFIEEISVKGKEGKIRVYELKKIRVLA
ncbi:MAG: adenylate/guanylate cyclase domain-containing protein, partial [Deltaproteobacteria bacterium]|nr:adenylate/guanylate cyclase domain-containing protein [Deltaproteobacteria bacterium]